MQKALPLANRLGNASVSYVTYLEQMVLPVHLAAFYPYPANLSGWLVACAGALFFAITGLILWSARKSPYLPIGWLWYLGMLVPVIGLVQAGAQSHADRYTYLPQIGLYLILVWA